MNNIGPKALRDEIYRGLDQLTGLETLNLGSGSGPGSTSGTSGTEIIRKRVFMSFKFLQNLTSLSFTNECQNETLAVVGQNCRLLSHLDIAGILHQAGPAERISTWYRPDQIPPLPLSVQIFHSHHKIKSDYKHTE